MYVHPINVIPCFALVSGQIKSFPEKMSPYNEKATKTAKSLMNGNEALDRGRRGINVV
jgi:hypothetical protein